MQQTIDTSTTVDPLMNSPQPPHKKSSFLGALVKNVLILTACVGLGAGAGFGLAGTQTPMWQSTMKFEAPTIVELGNYYSLATTYALVQGDKMAEVEQTITQKSYNEFKRNLNSADQLKRYLVDSDIVKQQASAKNLPIDTVAQQTALAFHFDEPKAQLSVTLENPENAKKLLADFVSFSTLQTRSILNNELIQKWKVLFQQVKQASEHNLGTVQIGEQVAKQDWSGKLNVMKSVKALDDQLVAYRVLQSPSSPTEPHSPDKSLWLMIGALSGLVFGLFCVALLSFRRKSI